VGEAKKRRDQVGHQIMGPRKAMELLGTGPMNVIMVGAGLIPALLQTGKMGAMVFDKNDPQKFAVRRAFCLGITFVPARLNYGRARSAARSFRGFRGYQFLRLLTARWRTRGRTSVACWL
jgi:hypothetical protein